MTAGEMTASTLDRAFAAMQADAEDDVARLRYYGELANTDLCLLLDKEAGTASLTPQVFDLDGGRYVLLFDGDERLADFVGAAAPCAHLAGRVVVGLLAGKGIGLAINLESSASILMPAEAVTWLDDMLTRAPDVVEAVPETVEAPEGLPGVLLEALADKLARAAGQARAAYLAKVTYHGGGAAIFWRFPGPTRAPKRRWRGPPARRWCFRALMPGNWMWRSWGPRIRCWTCWAGWRCGSIWVLSSRGRVPRSHPVPIRQSHRFFDKGGCAADTRGCAPRTCGDT